MASLLLKVETLERQQTEREDYLAVLKDQVASKEQQTGMLQADVSTIMNNRNHHRCMLGQFLFGDLKRKKIIKLSKLNEEDEKEYQKKIRELSIKLHRETQSMEEKRVLFKAARETCIILKKKYGKENNKIVE